MARGKVQLKRIENPVHRQVTFCKRRATLLKKSRELSVLCDADIGVVVFSNHGKLFELATKGTLKGLIERYKMACGDTADANQAELISEFKQEISILKQEIYLQHRCLRFMLGEEAAELMTVDELVALERHLQAWMHHIRARKMQIIFQAIQSLKNKEDMLTAANEILQGKILEQYWLFDVSPYHN